MNVLLKQKKSEHSHPIYLVEEKDLHTVTLPASAKIWIEAQDFKAKEGTTLLFPDAEGDIGGIILGLGNGKNPFATGALSKILKSGSWYFTGSTKPNFHHVLGFLMGAYQFDRYISDHQSKDVELVLPEDIEEHDINRQADNVKFVRDLINTPANDMTPQILEDIMRVIADQNDARIDVITGDDLLAKKFPLIHAVGKAGAVAPRLIDMRWGDKNAPCITLVGKGVCFDTGGLDIKGATGMLLMKKDMGGAANVLGLARMIMDAGLKLQLRVLVPAVENAIAGNAFRPGDIITSRKGISVEISNTDAEGRLILADALAYGDEESPELLIDMATLTGAARIALGPDVPPFFTHDDKLADQIAYHAASSFDPLWRMPLWQPYMKNLASPVADINNVTTDNFAGCITAALFLSRFTEKAKSWAHFDVYGWTPFEKPGFPKGGEAYAIRALYNVISAQYGY